MPPGMSAAGRRGFFMIPSERGRASHAPTALSGQTAKGLWTLLSGVIWSPLSSCGGPSLIPYRVAEPWGHSAE